MTKKVKKHQIPEEFQQPIEVEDFLDLHGFFPEQIAEVVTEFLRAAIEKGYARVWIAHGKGKSRLKWEVRNVLKNHADVVEFGDAAPREGGWGRTVVELKKR